MILQAKFGMAFQRLLLNNGLIFIAAIAFITEGSPQYVSSTENVRLTNNTIPKHYNIRLSPVMEEYNNKYIKEDCDFSYNGEIDVNIEIFRSTEDIIIHCVPLIDVWSIELLENNNTYQALSRNFNPDLQLLVMRFNTLAVGQYTLKIKFRGTSIIYGLNNFFKVSYNDPEKLSIFATRFYGIGARYVLPCWDEPIFRTTFNISVKHHSKYKAVSNMPILKTDVENDEILWTHFETTFLIPINLAAIAIYPTKFNTYSDQKISVLSRSSVKQDVEFVNIVARNVTALLESKWDRVPKFPKIDLVAIPMFWDDGTSYPGLILFREHNIICKDSDFVAHKMEVLRLIGYKMAYQLFGGIVGPSWWSDLWINKGLSLLIGMEAAVDKVAEGFQMMDLFTVQEQYESLQLNSYFVLPQEVNKPSEINTLLYFPHHIKAFCLLRMLQHLLSRETFKDGLRMYLNAGFKSKTSDSFWYTMQVALARQNLNSPPDIKNLMNQWTQQMNYPIVTATRNYDNGKMEVSISNYNKSDVCWIPLTFTTQSDINFNQTALIYASWLEYKETKSKTLKIPHKLEIDDWIIINIQQSGYYRVNYDERNWLNIATYLKTPNYVNIHVLNRAKIIDDAFYFLVSGNLKASIIWDLTSYLSQETDFTVWYPMFKVFESMSTILPFSNKRVERIKEKMSQMLDVLQKTGYEEKDENNLQNRLIKEAAKWACLIRHSGCISAARNKFHDKLEKPEKKILPRWEEWTYCYGMIGFNNKWDRITTRGISHELIRCTDSHAIVIKHLELITDRQAKEKILIECLHSIIAIHSRNDAVLEYMLLHFDEIKLPSINTVAMLIDIINHVYSEKQLSQINKFAIKSKVKHLIPHIQDKIDIRMSQINAQMNFIKVWES